MTLSNAKSDGIAHKLTLPIARRLSKVLRSALVATGCVFFVEELSRDARAIYG
jgi:hypothetical protein